MFYTNHFIFKIFDGKNFFDIDNFNEKMKMNANNTCKYKNVLWEPYLLIYCLD